LENDDSSRLSSELPESVPKSVSSLLAAVVFALNVGIGIFFSTGPFWYVSFECFMNMETKREMKNREVYSRLYSHMEWFISTSIVSLIMIIFYNIIYSTIAFLLIGYPSVFYPKYLYSSILFAFASYCAGIATRSLTRKQTHAFIVYPFFIILGAINCSLFVRDNDVPAWFAWTGYLTPFRFMYFASMLGALPPGGMTGAVPNEFLLGFMGVEIRSFGGCLWAMLAQGVVSLVIGGLANSYLYTND